MERVIINLPGRDFSLDLPASSTIQELKNAIDAELGVATHTQDLYFHGFPLTEGAANLSDYLKLSNNFSLVLADEDADRLGAQRRLPRSFSTDKDMFLITFLSGIKNFESILVRSNTEEWIKLKSARFGISQAQDIEGEESGRRIFQVRIYEAKKKGSVCMRTDGGASKVDLVTDEGEKELLTPIDTKKYDESKRLSPFESASKILPFFSALGVLLTGGGVVAEAFQQ